MKSKILGRAAKFGWRTPFLNEKRRMRNIETRAWKVEALDELAEEKEEQELEAFLEELEAKSEARLKWVHDIINKT